MAGADLGSFDVESRCPRYFLNFLKDVTVEKGPASDIPDKLKNDTHSLEEQLLR
jgi:hypothetical protein